MNRRRFLKLTPAAIALLNPTQPQRANASCAAPPWDNLLAVFGNSISSNWPARSGAWPTYQTWPSQLERDPWMIGQGFGVVNFSVKGSNILDMSERAPGDGDKLGHAAHETYAVVWELTNTMYYWSVADTFHMHANYCKARRAAGFKVLVGTGISRDNGHFNIPNGYTWPMMLELNNMIRTYWVDFADGVLDFASIPQLGSEFSWQDESMFIDRVHLTDAGSALCKGVVLAELQRQVTGSVAATHEPTSTPAETATPRPLDTIVATVAPRATPTVTSTALVQTAVATGETGGAYYMPVVGR